MSSEDAHDGARRGLEDMNILIKGADDEGAGPSGLYAQKMGKGCRNRPIYISPARFTIRLLDQLPRPIP